MWSPGLRALLEVWSPGCFKTYCACHCHSTLEWIKSVALMNKHFRENVVDWYVLDWTHDVLKYCLVRGVTIEEIFSWSLR